MEHKILVILSPGFEETEAITVIDILRRAGLQVTTASLEENCSTRGSHGITVEADIAFSAAADDYSCIVLPGGMRGVENMLSSKALMDFVQKMSLKDTILAAVCAAPLVFDQCGLLEKHKFTCHPCVYERIKSSGVQETPVCTDGKFVTGRSAGCAMAWSLELVQKLTGCISTSLLNGLRLP